MYSLSAEFKFKGKREIKNLQRDELLKISLTVDGYERTEDKKFLVFVSYIISRNVLTL